MRLTRRQSRYFNFLPDTITAFNLFTGFLSILMASQGKMQLAGWLIAIALVWDSLDGNLARAFKNPTLLGRELDSLADIVSFVVAPAFLVYSFLLNPWNLWIVLLLFLYLGAGAYRLARFNVQPPVKDYFVGLPTPAAAMVLSMTLLACVKNHWTDPVLFSLITVSLLVILSCLMVSEIRYPKLSALRFSKWQSFFYAGAAVFAVVFFPFNVQTALCSLSLLYLFLSPLYCLPSYHFGTQGEIHLSPKDAD